MAPRTCSGSNPSFSIFLVLMSSIVPSMMFAGLKLGGNERGGKSLNVASELEDFVHHAVHAADVVDVANPRRCWT